MIAHSIINVPMTPAWQGILLAVFAVIIFLGWRRGLAAIRQVFSGLNLLVALLLAILLGVYALSFSVIPGKASCAVVLLALAVVLGLVHRRKRALVSTIAG